MTPETATSKDELIAAFREAEAMLNERGSVTMFFGDGNKSWQCEEVKIEKQRTNLQNKALHKYFSMVSEALNAAGIDMRTFFKEGVDIPWSETLVKERIWKPVQEIVIAKGSTADAETHEYAQVYEILNRKLAEYGIHVSWPSRFNRGEAA